MLEGEHDGIDGQSQLRGMQELHVSLHDAAIPSIAHKSSELSATITTEFVVSFWKFIGMLLQYTNLLVPAISYVNCSVESEHLSSLQVPHVIGQWTLTPGNPQRSAVRHLFPPTHVQKLPTLFPSLS